MTVSFGYSLDELMELPIRRAIGQLEFLSEHWEDDKRALNKAKSQLKK